MDLDAEHWTPATILRHRHLNPSGKLGCAHHVTSRSQVLHCTLLLIRLTSFRNCTVRPWSQKRYVMKSLFGPPFWRTILRPYEPRGMNGISCRRFSYSWKISWMFPTISDWTHCTELYGSPNILASDLGANECCTGSVWFWVWEKNTRVKLRRNANRKPK